MNPQIIDSSSTNPSSINSCPSSDLPRCQHRTRSGRRCRQAVSSIKAGFCSTHAHSYCNRSEEADLSAYLTAGITDFKSAVAIGEFLSRLLRLQAEDRISPRRAAVMAYTANLVLRTLPAIEAELHPEDEIVRLDFGDLPRPRDSRHAPPSHPDMSWLAPLSGTATPESSS
jgi:hypothetical protein